MKRLALLLALLSTPVAAVEILTDYMTAFQRRAAIFGVPGSGYWGAWNSYGNGTFGWCETPTSCASPVSYEHMSVRTCNGAEWYVLEAFGSHGHRWPIRTIKATLTDIATGTTFEITSDCWKTGHPYALNRVPAWPYRMRVWGEVANQFGVYEKRFYWESDVYPPEPKLNVCMGVTALAIRQTEVWADVDMRGNVIAVARGTSTAPFDSFGKPIVPVTTHDWNHWAAKGWGTAWTMGNSQYPVICMFSGWGWA
jgi:hypothetical protein